MKQKENFTPLQKNAIKMFQKVIRGYIILTKRECLQQNSLMPFASGDRGWILDDVHDILYQPFYIAESNDRTLYMSFANAQKGSLYSDECRDFWRWIDEAEDEELDLITEKAISSMKSYGKGRIEYFLAHCSITEGREELVEALKN